MRVPPPRGMVFRTYLSRAHQARFNSEQNESRTPISWSTQMIGIPRDAGALVVSVAELASFWLTSVFSVELPGIEPTPKNSTAMSDRSTSSFPRLPNPRCHDAASSTRPSIPPMTSPRLTAHHQSTALHTERTPTPRSCCAPTSTNGKPTSPANAETPSAALCFVRSRSGRRSRERYRGRWVGWMQHRFRRRRWRPPRWAPHIQPRSPASVAASVESDCAAWFQLFRLATALDLDRRGDAPLGTDLCAAPADPQV